MRRVQVRVKDEVLSRWSEAAERRGVSVSEMVREIVEGDLDGRVTQAQGIEQMAERIGGRLEGVLTGMLDAHLLALDASLHSAQGQHVAAAPGLPPGYVPVGPPRPQPFDRACENFDVHSVGTVCAICGGSTA